MSKHTKGELKCGKDVALWVDDIKICTLSYPTEEGDFPSRPIDELEDELQANAQYIIKCWNCHDELVAACEEAYKEGYVDGYADGINADESCVPETTYFKNDFKKAWDKSEAKAILAKVKEQQ